MKKLLLLIGCSGFLLADLVLEITQGSEKAIKLAVLQVGESTFEGNQVIDIVNNDLRRTGEFEVLTTDQLLSIPSAEEDVIQRDWLLLEADAIIFLNVVTTDGVFDINYSIFDIRYKESVEKRKILGLPDSVRQTSHYVSDGIYEFFYGIEGVASTKLMYVAKNSDVYRLIVSDADGFNEQVLLKSNKSIISPAWSSDAKDIAYVSFENNRAQVFIQNLELGKRELILSSNSSVSSPAWSPDKKHLAFSSTMDGNSEIYLINLQTKEVQRLTDNTAIDTEPAWSKDGKSLLFTSDRAGSPQIYQIDIRTKLKRRVTTEGNYNARAAYLNKDEIVFVHRNSSDFNIAKLNLKSRDLDILTSTSFDESPCIAPNGNVVIYSTKEGNLSYLAGVNISSRVKFKLPALYGELKEPAWSPFLR